MSDDLELRDSAQRIWLAGLGALAAAEEEGSRLFHTLIDRGARYQSRVTSDVEQARKSLESTAEDAAGTARSRAGETWGALERAFDSRVTDTLHRIGIPSQKEVKSLTRRVEKLTRTIEEIQARGGLKKKASAKKRAAKKSTKKKSAAKKRTAKKTTGKKAAARKTTKKKTKRKATSRKAPARKTAAKKKTARRKTTVKRKGTRS